MLAVVMAGGKGTRLRPLTGEKPKPMVPVANRPLLEHVLRLLTGQGWDEIVLTLCYRPEIIEAYFGDGRGVGARLRYLVEDKPLGTAGSVRMARELFTETVLVGSGDALSDFDFRAALAFHRERRAAVTIILTRVASPLEYGIVVTEPDGRIGRFLEKPGWGEVFSDTVNTGFYLIEPEVFEFVPAGEPFDFSRDLFPRLLAQGVKLYGYVAEGYWSDIGTIEQYRRAHEEILAGKARLLLGGGERSSGVWVGPGTEIHPEAILEAPALVGAFCHIERGARVGPYTVLGDHTLVAEGTAVNRSVVWCHVYLGPRSEVEGAVLGDRALVRNDVTIEEGAIVGDGVTVGPYSRVRSEARIFPGRQIAGGSVVRGSVVAGHGMLRGLFGNHGVTGLANLELTPENAARLGAAFASALLTKGQRVALAADGFPVTRLLKRALAAGILGSGVGINDLGTLTAPATRYAVGFLSLAGGAYLGLSDRERGRAVIQFFNARGLPLARQEERLLEQAYFGEDFRRVEAAEAGEIFYVPGMAKSYLEAVMASLAAEAIRAAGFTLVSPPLSGASARLVPSLLRGLGCRWVTLGVPETQNPLPRERETLRQSEKEMECLVAAEGASFGFAVDGFGEELFVLVPGRGWLEETKLAALLALAELRRGGRRLPLPVTAPEAVVELARTYRGEVIRTKSHRRFLYEEYASFSPALGGLLLPVFDAVLALARLLELMALEGKDLASLLTLLPPHARVERAVACAWEEKGRLMRRLFEESRGRRLDLTAGLKIEEEGGWALVLPDGEDPFIRVFAEAGTLEEAEAINRFYLEKLTALRAGERA
ncbi:MAG: sugar phosphate nucleotidyltransferase [Bacillota bacterium]